MAESLLRVLYVEDNFQDADLVSSYLKEHAPCIELQIVTTGRACLDRLYEREPDVLLLDHRLPDMDGLGVLKTLIHTGVQVPVIMVTGMGEEELVVNALRLGAVNYVPKTAHYVESLPDMLQEVAGEYRRKKQEGLLTPVARRILYVEHNSMDIELTLAHFADIAPHFMIDVARTCSEALRCLQETSAYDLILIDLRMPEQSGLDFIRETRQLFSGLPPFVIISGKGDEETAIATLKLGAADYVIKQSNYLDQLVYTIDRAISYNRLNHLNHELQYELKEHKRTEEQRKALEAQLFQSQKMEAIGRLASGIAHDFNNMLSVIMAYAEGLMRELGDGNPLQGDVREIVAAGERSAALTRQLLTLSHKQITKPEIIDLNAVVKELEKMLHRVLGRNVDLVMTLSAELLPVLADRGHLEQVIMNLVVNARDAMPKGGLLKIETANADPGDVFTSEVAGRAPEQYVRLTVTDTGIGMDEKIQLHLFEPFFTTKGEGIGTGLGLSTVYGIVKQSGGNIQVESRPGEGATFRIYLPSPHRH